jgi:hypothetical protein
MPPQLCQALFLFYREEQFIVQSRDGMRPVVNFFIFLKIQEEKTEKSESAEPSAGVLESCRLMKRNQNGRIGARRN